MVIVILFWCTETETGFIAEKYWSACKLKLKQESSVAQPHFNFPIFFEEVRRRLIRRCSNFRPSVWCLLGYLIRSSVCRWLWSRRLLSVFSRLCSRTFSSSRCLSALREAISLCCLSRCLSASSWVRASRLRVWWSSSSTREHLGPHAGAASGAANFSFLSCCCCKASSLQIWEHGTLLLVMLS